MSTSITTTIKRVLSLLLFTLLFIGCTFLSLKFFRTLHFFFISPFSLNIVEGLSLYFAQQIVSGYTIYTSIYHAPFTLNLYPPVYPLISAGLIKILPYVTENIYILRGLTLASEFSVSILISLIVFYKTKDSLISISILCAGLGLWSMNSFHGIARVDFIALVFSLVALLSFLILLDKKSRLAAFMYIVGTLLSVLTKQTSGVIFVSCVIYTIYMRADRKIHIANLSIISIYIIITIILTLVTSGEYFKQNFIYQLIYGFDPEHRVYQLWLLYGNYGYLLAWLGISTIFHRDVFLLLYLFLCASWTIFSIGKVGADQNYGIELITIILIVIGTSFGKYFGRKKHFLRVLLTVLFLIHTCYVVNSQKFYYFHNFDRDVLTEKKHIGELIQSSDGLILSEDPLSMLRSHKDTVTYDPFLVWWNLSYAHEKINDLSSLLMQDRIQWVYSSIFLDQVPEISTMLHKKFILIYESKNNLVHGRWRVYKRL